MVLFQSSGALKQFYFAGFLYFLELTSSVGYHWLCTGSLKLQRNKGNLREGSLECGLTWKQHPRTQMCGGRGSTHPLVMSTVPIPRGWSTAEALHIP